jgi:hypothetical protein
MAYSDEVETRPLELQNIENAYVESFNFLQSWKRRKVNQLVLLNNLQRGDQNIASTLLVTLFLRSVSNNYDDKIQVKFLPSQGIEQEQLNAFNTLAQSDYKEMGKDRLDYEWVWDALFFGRGWCETYKFNKKRKIMEPQIINPLVFGYDPYFENVQDWRYYWKWITKSKYEIQRLIANGTITGIERPEEIPGGVDPYLWNYKFLRDKAKKGIEPPPQSQASDVYQILEYYGYDSDGKKTCYWVDKSFSKVLYEETLDFEDLDYGDQDEKGSKWPIVDKGAFKEPHSSLYFGVPDLLEDKHRAKSVLMNLAFIAAKDRANPIYLYDTNKVTDVTQLFSRQINQHIPVSDVEGAVVPLNTEDPMSAGLIQFISMLTQEANDPIGTGQVGQPMAAKGDKTATHDAINQQLNDMATSLQSKVMQFGESEFWSHWFHRYAKYGPELKTKLANIVGVKGIDTQIIDFKMFNTDYPPGVLIYSAKEAEYKELVLRRDLMQLYPELAQTLDADGLRNFNKYVFFPKFLQDPSLIDVMLPKTLDEIKAEDENQQLADEKMVQAQPTDNHQTHLYVHMMIPPGKRTWELWFHIQQHEALLAQQKAMEMQAQQQALMQGNAGQTQAQPNTLNVGAEKRNPQAAASPLKTAINPSNQLINNNAQNTQS